jgi:peroxiredoxin Q/BCP
MQMTRWRQLMAGVALAAWALAASAVNVGDKAPEFSAPSSTGKEIKLSDFAGKKHTVLFFYIGAFTNT